MANQISGSIRRGTLALLLATGGFAAMTPNPSSAADATPTRPILIELFTSQGCSSCPPADAVLRDISTQGDVLPLAFHVDYWDYLGWADPFASPTFTARQRAYASHRGFNVYTPQMVVDGRSASVGSNRSGVLSSIASAKEDAKGAPSTLTRAGGDVNVTIGTAPAAGASASGKVYLISFDERQSTAIRSGENAGRNIVYANVVRSMRSIGEWQNAPLKITERLRPEERGERLALLVQSNAGDVWAVASTPASVKAASRDQEPLSSR